jgi:hypothetical protein
MAGVLLTTPFIVIWRGIALPAGVPGWIKMLIWYRPTYVDIPENNTCAGTPPTVTVGVIVVACGTPSFGTSPVAIGGFTGPNPVARIASPAGSPILAACVVKPGMDPGAAAKRESLLL